MKYTYLMKIDCFILVWASLFVSKIYAKTQQPELKPEILIYEPKSIWIFKLNSSK